MYPLELFYMILILRLYWHKREEEKKRSFGHWLVRMFIVNVRMRFFFSSFIFNSYVEIHPWQADRILTNKLFFSSSSSAALFKSEKDRWWNAVRSNLFFPMHAMSPPPSYFPLDLKDIIVIDTYTRKHLSRSKLLIYIKTKPRKNMCAYVCYEIIAWITFFNILLFVK